MSLCSPVLLQCVCSSFLCSRDRCSVMVLGMLVSLWHNKFTSLDPCLALAFCFSCEQAFCLNLVLSSLGLPLGLQWAFIWNKKTKRIKPKAKPSCIITRQYKCRCFSTNPSLIILQYFWIAKTLKSICKTKVASVQTNVLIESHSLQNFKHFSCG